MRTKIEHRDFVDSTNVRIVLVIQNAETEPYKRRNRIQQLGSILHDSLIMWLGLISKLKLKKPSRTACILKNNIYITFYIFLFYN